MNKKLKKLIAGFMLVGMMVLTGPLGQMVSWAGDTKIAFSDPSVMVGNDVTVTMKLTSDSALGTAEIMLAYDPNILEFVSGTNANGGAGAIKVLGTMESQNQKAFQFKLKFKALKAGNTQISVTSQEIYDIDSQALTLSKQGASTVKVTSPATYSKDATLKSLKISPGTLTPEFSASVVSYTANVDGSTADLIVNAVAANAGASVALSGEKGLKAGENQVVVKVTAEDGQTVKNYTIVVTKEEGGETVPAANANGETAAAEFSSAKVTIDGTEYSVASSFDETSLPEGFEAETYQFKGNQVMAGKGLEKDLLLLYLQDAGGNGGFYIYNEGADSWTRFVSVETSTKAIVIIPLDADAAVPEGFTERQVDIDGIRVTGWVENSEAEPEYCLFYAMNWNGEKNFYRYDLTEKTIQRYFASGVANDKYEDTATKYNELIGDYHLQFYILIAVSVLALALLVAVIILVRRGGGTDSGRTGKGGSGMEDSQEGTAADRFYDKTEEKIPSSRIRRYSREEFDRESSKIQIDPDYFEDEMDKPEENDADRRQRADRNRHAEKTEPLNVEDDFEFMDLDD